MKLNSNAEEFEVNAESTIVDLDLDFIKNRITVQPPYFAFNRLYQCSDSDWDIYGEVFPEQPLGAEEGMITTAEAGRHLAILGTCAAALSERDGESIYYLATRAVGHLDHDKAVSKNWQSSLLTARVRITSRDRKTLKVYGEMLLGENSFMSIRVEYFILPYKLFSRVFSKDCCSNASLLKAMESPYKQPMALDFEAPRDLEVSAHSASDSPGQCSGHFDNYPMWPVAIIVYGVGQVITHLLQYITSKDVVRYQVRYIEVDAFKLMPVSVRLSFHATLLEVNEDGLFSLSCRVTGDGQEVAKVDLLCLPNEGNSLLA